MAMRNDSKSNLPDGSRALLAVTAIVVLLVLGYAFIGRDGTRTPVNDTTNQVTRPTAPVSPSATPVPAPKN